MGSSDCFSMADEMWGQPTRQGFAYRKEMLKGKLGALSGNTYKGNTESMTKHIHTHKILHTHSSYCCILYVNYIFLAAFVAFTYLLW